MNKNMPRSVHLAQFLYNAFVRYRYKTIMWYIKLSFHVKYSCKLRGLLKGAICIHKRVFLCLFVALPVPLHREVSVCACAASSVSHNLYICLTLTVIFFYLMAQFFVVPITEPRQILLPVIE